MSRKGENIFFRKDGRWETRYVKDQLENGKYKYGYVYGKSYMEVKQKEVSNRYTFNYYMDRWLQSIKFLVKSSTYAHYYSIVKNHIKPYLGNMEVRNIKPLL